MANGFLHRILGLYPYSTVSVELFWLLHMFYKPILMEVKGINLGNKEKRLIAGCFGCFEEAGNTWAPALSW